jgi:hypothetical protein
MIVFFSLGLVGAADNVALVVAIVWQCITFKFSVHTVGVSLSLWIPAQSQRLTLRHRCLDLEPQMKGRSSVQFQWSE